MLAFAPSASPSSRITVALKPGLRARRRNAKRRSRIIVCLLFVTQRFDRTDTRRAASRQPAGDERGRCEYADDRDQRQRIDDADAEQLRLDQLRQRERADQADAEADPGQARAV